MQNFIIAAGVMSAGMMQHMCRAPLEPEHGQAAALCRPAPGTAPCRTAEPGKHPRADCQQTPAIPTKLNHDDDQLTARSATEQYNW